MSEMFNEIFGGQGSGGGGTSVFFWDPLATQGQPYYHNIEAGVKKTGIYNIIKNPTIATIDEVPQNTSIGTSIFFDEVGTGWGIISQTNQQAQRTNPSSVADEIELNTTFPTPENYEGQSCYVQSTNTYWSVKLSGLNWVWYDTGEATLDSYSKTEMNAFLQTNSTFDTNLVNNTVQGIFTPNNTAIATNDNGKVAFEKTQGQLNEKVDKVAGKQLSTEDLTTALKANYDTAYTHSQTSGNPHNTSHTQLSDIGTNTHVQIDAHIANITNPHGVTKAQVGLGNVDNTSDTDKPISTATQIALDTKVDKVAGKQLSTEDYTTAEKDKLAGIEANATADQTDAEIKTAYENNANTNAFTDAEKTKLLGIEAGAEVNIQADWNETDNSQDSFIQNKPTLGTVASKNVGTAIGNIQENGGILGNAEIVETTATGKFITASKNTAYNQNFGTANSEVARGDASYLKADTYTKTEIDNSLNLKQNTSEKGQVNGYASLDGTGKVPASQLPSFVDDVLEYLDLASFPAIGETSKVYVALDTNLTYRWSGTIYVKLNDVDLTNYFNKVTDTTDNITQGTAKFTTQVDIDKLAGIEANATADQTDAEIKTAYENNADTNAFTDAEKTKLSGVEAGAEVNVQSDWNETDNSQDSFIQNKPDLALKENVANKTSAFQVTPDDIKYPTEKLVKDSLDGKEPAFAKNTAFNKDFGTGAGEVLEGNSVFDASKITTGVLDIARIPATALNNLAVVADEAARFLLTTATVQIGDTVKQTDNGLLYLVKDDTNLNNASGYEEYVASTDWSAINSKPANITEIESITKTDDDFIQVKGGAFINRTVLQVKTDLALDNVPNTDATNLANDTIQGTFTPNNTAIVTGDTGKVVAEKTQGQLNKKVGVSASQTFTDGEILQASRNIKATPNFTTAERDALVWVAGEQNINKDTGFVEQYDGSIWNTKTTGEIIPLLKTWYAYRTDDHNGGVVADRRVLQKSEYAEAWSLLVAQGLTTTTATEYGKFLDIDASTFAIPDGRGYFVRGNGTNSDGTSSGAFGELQGDAIRNITGRITTEQNGNGVFDGAFGVTADTADGSSGLGSDNVIDFDASRVVPTADENRPKNIALTLFIKVKNTPVGSFQVNQGSGIVVNNDTNAQTSTISTSANKNYILNGGFQVWQRGTPIVFTTSEAKYTADEWVAKGENFSVEKIDAGTSFSARVQRTNGDTATTDRQFGHSVDLGSIKNFLAGKQCTLSLSIFLGADFSSATGVELNVRSGTNAGDNINLSGFATGAVTLDTQITTTTTGVWQTLTSTFTVPSDAKSLLFELKYSSPQGTAGANDYFDVAGNVKLEIGSVATPFIQEIESEVLNKCLGYYERIVYANSGGAVPCYGAMANASNQILLYLQYLRKNNIPTVSINRQNAINILIFGTDTTSSAVSFINPQKTSTRCDITTVGTITGGYALLPNFVSNTDFIEIDATRAVI